MASKDKPDFEPGATIEDAALADAMREFVDARMSRPAGDGRFMQRTKQVQDQAAAQEDLKNLPAEIKPKAPSASSLRKARLQTVVVDDDGKTAIADWQPVEAMFYKAFTKNWDIAEAIESSGISPAAAHALIYTPKFTQMVQRTRLEMAKSKRARDPNFLDSFAHDVLTGNKKITREQADIFKTMLRRGGLMPKDEPGPKNAKPLTNLAEADEYIFVAKKGGDGKPLDMEAAKSLLDGNTREVINVEPCPEASQEAAGDSNPADSPRGAGEDREPPSPLQSS